MYLDNAGNPIINIQGRSSKVVVLIIGNIVIAGQAGSGKSTILMKLVKSISQTHRAIVVTDGEEEAQQYLKTSQNCLYPKAFSFDGKINLIKEALEQRPHILAVDEIREAREASLLYDIITKGELKVWFTLASSTSMADILYKFNALLGFTYNHKNLNELQIKLDTAIVLKPRRTGEKPQGDIFSHGNTSLYTQSPWK